MKTCRSIVGWDNNNSIIAKDPFSIAICNGVHLEPDTLVLWSDNINLTISKLELSTADLMHCENTNLGWSYKSLTILKFPFFTAKFNASK